MRWEEHGTSAVIGVLERERARGTGNSKLTGEAELEYEEMIVVEHRNLHINSLDSCSKKVVIYLGWK